MAELRTPKDKGALLGAIRDTTMSKEASWAFSPEVEANRRLSSGREVVKRENLISGIIRGTNPTSRWAENVVKNLVLAAICFGISIGIGVMMAAGQAARDAARIAGGG